MASVALPFNQNNTPFTAAECTAFASSLVAGLNSASLEHQSTTITPNVTSLACYTDTELGTPRIRVVLEVDDATFAAVKVSDEASSTIPTTVSGTIGQSATPRCACTQNPACQATTGVWKGGPPQGATQPLSILPPPDMFSRPRPCPPPRTPKCPAAA